MCTSAYFAYEVIPQFRILFLNMDYAPNVRSIQHGESYQHLVGQSHRWVPLLLNHLLCRVDSFMALEKISFFDSPPNVLPQEKSKNISICHLIKHLPLSYQCVVEHFG